MSKPPLSEVISARTETEAAAIVERVWEARGYDARVRFSGPDVHVEAAGETPDGTAREVRVWVTAGGRIAAHQTRAYAQQCDRADVEPYLVVIGDARLAGDAHRPEIVELDASSLAARVREAGVESSVYDFVERAADAGDDVARDWLGDPIDETAEETATDDDSSADGDDEDRLGRRAAIKRGSKYVVASFLTYLAVERLSEELRRSPGLRSDIDRRIAWLGARLPDLEAPISESTPEPTEAPETPANGSIPSVPNGSAQGTPPADTTALSFESLRSDPAAFVGTTVRYSGEVAETTERRSKRFVVIRVEEGGAWRGDLVGRWPAGRFFDGSLGFRLLDGSTVTVWGDVLGTSSVIVGETLPAIEVVAFERV
jgi:hypothetical protein